MTTPQTLIIAEAGVNHNGSIDLALQLVDAAAQAGADFVKFQTFKADRLATSAAPKAEYQKTTTGTQESQLEMLRKLELSDGDHQTLIAHCKRRGIRFLSSPFDVESLQFLAKDLALDVIKIPSGEITNSFLLLEAARSDRELILSTGMASLEEIEAALSVLAFGYMKTTDKPNRAAFQDAYQNAAARTKLRECVTLLHCTTEYPAPLDDIHLQAMDVMRSRFDLTVGYSDHTPGLTVTIAAVARGARVIEKHLTLNRELPGPDHKASLEPDAFALLVQSVRDVERALGKPIKECQPSETKNRQIARKGLYASADIAQGELLTAQNLTMKRPVAGKSAFDYWDVLGTPAPRPISKGEPL